MTYVYLAIIALQFVLLGLAIFWRKHRVEKRHRTKVPMNGFPRGAMHTPARGTTIFQERS